MSTKGVTLAQGQVVVLALDGTLVYVEQVEQFFIGVVALPDQPTERADDRVFTPGRVGAKKISPMATADKVVPVEELSDRNKTFIATYEALRAQHGNNYIGDDGLRAAAEAAANQPDKATVKAQQKAERAATKAAKKSSGPKFLQRCEQCNEQPGHPNHPKDHEFVAPAPPVVLCAACDKPEGDHAENALGHRYIPTGKIKAVRAPKEPKAPKDPSSPKPVREKKAKPGMVAPNQKFKWVDNDAALAALIAGNGKFSAGNSGGGMIATVKIAGDVGISVMEIILQHPRPVERLQLAFGQLLGAGLLEAV